MQITLDIPEKQLIKLADLIATRLGAPPVEVEDNRLKIHAVYQGRRIEGLYDPKIKMVTLDLAGEAWHKPMTPSGAAVALVRKMNPEVTPERNGWDFWQLEDGRRLQSIRWAERDAAGNYPDEE